MTGWKYFLLIFCSVAFLITLPFVFKVDQNIHLNVPKKDSEKHYLQWDSRSFTSKGLYRCIKGNQEKTAYEIHCFDLLISQIEDIKLKSMGE